MPSSAELTFERIKREIQEAKQREEELQHHYSRSISTVHDGVTNETKPQNGNPVYQRTKSMPNGEKSLTNGSRLFSQNVVSRGVMHRFLKSGGKLTTVKPLAIQPAIATPAWSNDDIVVPAKIPVDNNKPLRNGYVPIEERIRKEFVEMQTRESELKMVRRKSQPDLFFHSDEDDDMSCIKPSKSVSNLDETESFSDDAMSSNSSSLKNSKSLAELCDTNDLQVPGSLSLIRQFESIIQQNQKVKS